MVNVAAHVSWLPGLSVVAWYASTHLDSPIMSCLQRGRPPDRLPPGPSQRRALQPGAAPQMLPALLPPRRLPERAAALALESPQKTPARPPAARVEAARVAPQGALRTALALKDLMRG